ncbi:MAG TPA: hypothetical protein VG942_13145 [Hyphomonadaceae bacterium]|nr:hypothetical protein [Hyphomonadaceae bacterium]
MKRIGLAVGVLWLGLGVPAWAACDPKTGPVVMTGMTIFEGSVGEHPITMALMLTDDGMPGRYAYPVSTADIVVSAKLDADQHHMMITEYDAVGNPSAVFDGVFLDRDPSIHSSTPLTCDVIEGDWRPKDKPDGVLHFRMRSTTFHAPAPFDRMYGNKVDVEAVNREAQAFRTAVVRDDRAGVVARVLYPITIGVDNAHETSFSTPAELMARYDEVFTPRLKKAITGAVPRMMFARQGQVMLVPPGWVWMDFQGKVTTLWPAPPPPVVPKAPPKAPQ